MPTIQRMSLVSRFAGPVPPGPAEGVGSTLRRSNGRTRDGTLTSAATATVLAKNHPATGAPTITGTAQVDQTLTAVTTGIMDDADGLTSPTYTYQWIRVNGTEADIADATASTYRPVDADLGKAIKVRVTFQDDDGNTETLTSAATQAVVAAAATTPVDTTAPTVTITSTASEPVSGPFSITIAFSEPVTGFALEDPVVGNGSASELQANEANYMATVTPAASGAVTVDVAAGAAQDSAGNPSAAADQLSIAADTAAPTVTITSTASEPVSGPFSITVTFSEPVTGFELEDLVVGNGTASELEGDGATATVTPAASGTVTVDIAAGAAQDGAGNPSAAVDQFSITADLTPVPALPVVGAIALAVLLLVGGVRRRGGALTTHLENAAACCSAARPSWSGSMRSGPRSTAWRGRCRAPRAAGYVAPPSLVRQP